MPLGRDERAPVTSAFQSQVRGVGLRANFVRTPQRPVTVAAPLRVATVRFDSQYLTASSPIQEYSVQ
jgi:hypothetical protein